MKARRSTLALLLSLGLYAACMPLNSFCVSSQCDDWPSWGVLAVGVFGLAADTPANTIWLANPLLFIAWGMTWWMRGWVGMALSLAALALGVSFLQYSQVTVSESGSASTITSLAAGYWLWLAAMAASAAAGVLGRLEARRTA